MRIGTWRLFCDWNGMLEIFQRLSEMWSSDIQQIFESGIESQFSGHWTHPKPQQHSVIPFFPEMLSHLWFPDSSPTRLIVQPQHLQAQGISILVYLKTIWRELTSSQETYFSVKELLVWSKCSSVPIMKAACEPPQREGTFIPSPK